MSKKILFFVLLFFMMFHCVTSAEASEPTPAPTETPMISVEFDCGNGTKEIGNCFLNGSDYSKSFYVNYDSGHFNASFPFLTTDNVIVLRIHDRITIEDNYFGFSEWANLSGACFLSSTPDFSDDPLNQPLLLDESYHVVDYSNQSFTFRYYDGSIAYRDDKISDRVYNYSDFSCNPVNGFHGFRKYREGHYPITLLVASYLQFKGYEIAGLDTFSLSLSSNIPIYIYDARDLTYYKMSDGSGKPVSFERTSVDMLFPEQGKKPVNPNMSTSIIATLDEGKYGFPYPWNQCTYDDLWNLVVCCKDLHGNLELIGVPFRWKLMQSAIYALNSVTELVFDFDVVHAADYEDSFYLGNYLIYFKKVSFRAISNYYNVPISRVVYDYNRRADTEDFEDAYVAVTDSLYTRMGDLGYILMNMDQSLVDMGSYLDNMANNLYTQVNYLTYNQDLHLKSINRHLFNIASAVSSSSSVDFSALDSKFSSIVSAITTHDQNMLTKLDSLLESKGLLSGISDRLDQIIEKLGSSSGSSSDTSSGSTNVTIDTSKMENYLKDIAGFDESIRAELLTYLPGIDVKLSASESTLTTIAGTVYDQLTFLTSIQDPLLRSYSKSLDQIVKLLETAPEDSSAPISTAALEEKLDQLLLDIADNHQSLLMNLSAVTGYQKQLYEFFTGFNTNIKKWLDAINANQLQMNLDFINTFGKWQQDMRQIFDEIKITIDSEDQTLWDKVKEFISDVLFKGLVVTFKPSDDYFSRKFTEWLQLLPLKAEFDTYAYLYSHVVSYVTDDKPSFTLGGTFAGVKPSLAYKIPSYEDGTPEALVMTHMNTALSDLSGTPLVDFSLFDDYRFVINLTLSAIMIIAFVSWAIKQLVSIFGGNV